MSNISIQPIDNTRSSAATPGQNGPWSNDNERILHISQNSRTGSSLSDCLMPYPGNLFRKSLSLSAEIQSVYSSALADWAIITWLTFDPYLFEISTGTTAKDQSRPGSNGNKGVNLDTSKSQNWICTTRYSLVSSTRYLF